MCSTAGAIQACIGTDVRLRARLTTTCGLQRNSATLGQQQLRTADNELLPTRRSLEEAPAFCRLACEAAHALQQTMSQCRRHVWPNRQNHIVLTGKGDGQYRTRATEAYPWAVALAGAKMIAEV